MLLNVKKKFLSRHILTNWQINYWLNFKNWNKICKIFIKGREELKVDKHIEIWN